MAHHHQIADHLADGMFFAYPGSPWLRGTNENTNGLLRQYFPKGTYLSIHSAEDLLRAERRLNHRPRKTLGWRTPADTFTTALAPSPTSNVATAAGIRPRTQASPGVRIRPTLTTWHVEPGGGSLRTVSTVHFQVRGHLSDPAHDFRVSVG